MKYVLLLIACCHLPKKVYSEPFKMVVVGDSFAAATFSNSDGFKRQKDIPEIGIKAAPRDISWVQKMLFKMTAWPEYGFVTGDKIKSHYKKMKELHPGIDFQAVNLATPGDRIQEIALHQAAKIRGMADAVFVVIEGGINNLCHADTIDQMTSTKEYEFWVRRAIEFIGTENKTIVLAPVPDLTVLPEIIKGKRTIFFITVETMWRLHGFCTIITEGKHVVAVRQRVKEYNQVLEKIASESDSIYFNKKAANFQPKAEHISRVDGFHAGIKGQRLMSDLTFPFQKEWERLGSK